MLAPKTQKVNVIPGVEMLFDWPLSKAVEIDRRNGMVEEMGDMILVDRAVTSGMELTLQVKLSDLHIPHGHADIFVSQ